MSRGVELRGVVVTILSLQFPEYLSFADIENLFYAVVGEITSTPPSTGECGSIAIARITDAFRRLRYTIYGVFLVMC